MATASTPRRRCRPPCGPNAPPATVLTATPDAVVTRSEARGWTEGQVIVDVVPGQTDRHYAEQLPSLRELAEIDVG